MSRRAASRSTSYSRQLDASVSKNVFAQPNVTVVAITPSGIDPNTVILYFNQPVAMNFNPVVHPTWVIGSATFQAFDALAADGKSLLAIFDSAISSGDAYDLPLSSTNFGYTPLLGGVWEDAAGQVVPSVVTTVMNVTGIDVFDATHADISFDLPVALVGSPDFTGFSILNGINARAISSVSSWPDASTARCLMNGAVTSGNTYTIPGGALAFISVTALPLAESSGAAT